MAVSLQGLPARAFAAEAKASGFDSRGWNAALKKINDYSDNPKANPLTQDTLDTFRKNFEVMHNNLVQRHEGAKKSFWEHDAPALAPTLRANGRLKDLQGGYEDE